MRTGLFQQTHCYSFPRFSTSAVLHARKRCLLALTSVSTCFRRFSPSSLTSIAFLSPVRLSHALSSSPTSSTYLPRRKRILFFLPHQNYLTLVNCRRSTLLASNTCVRRVYTCCENHHGFTSAHEERLRTSLLGTDPRRPLSCYPGTKQSFWHCISDMFFSVSSRYIRCGLAFPPRPQPHPAAGSSFSPGTPWSARLRRPPPPSASPPP